MGGISRVTVFFLVVVLGRHYDGEERTTMALVQVKKLCLGVRLDGRRCCCTFTVDGVHLHTQLSSSVPRPPLTRTL